MDRRKFFKIVSAGGVGLAIAPVQQAMAAVSPVAASPDSSIMTDAEPATNIKDALAIPRTKNSMPGLYPGKVVMATNKKCVVDGVPEYQQAYNTLKLSMLSLTGEKNLKKAWRKFVGTKDVIGLKLNPIGGKILSTSHAVTQAIITQLQESGIKKENIVIWDRRLMELDEAGFTSDKYPGIKITGTECKDASGSFYNKEGKLYGEENIDKEHFFFADCEMEYDAYTLPYMINEGKYSYFTKIVTQQVTKIINVPILKNAGATTTLCLKNLAFGSISNTARLHGKLWHSTCAQVCAFPPVRDKVVLNIVDGFIGCYEGGPGANPQFICNYDTMLVGSDPVAIDRIGHDIIVKKRIEEGIQKSDRPAAYKFVTLAQEYGLGVGEKEKIDLVKIEC
jgi:Domain of unknown function (DUF362)